MEKKKPLVSRARAARMLGKDRTTIQNGIDLGQIPSLRIGDRDWIPRSWVERVIAGELEPHRAERILAE